MSRSWEAPTPMERAVETAMRLPAASGARASAMTSLGVRLDAEMRAAIEDPKLYHRLEDRSELAAFARALGCASPADRAVLQASIGEPLLERARERDTPRKVRRAVVDALGKD